MRLKDGRLATAPLLCIMAATASRSMPGGEESGTSTEALCRGVEVREEGA